MQEMIMYPTVSKNLEEGIGATKDVNKQHLFTLNYIYPTVKSRIDIIDSNIKTSELSIDDFNKIQEFKNSLKFIENKIKELNLKVYNKDIAYIERFNPTSHKNTFKNTYLKEVIMNGVHYTDLDHWYELITIVADNLIAIDKDNFESNVTKLRGSTKPYFSLDRNELRRARELKNTDYLYESNFSAFDTISTCVKMLNAFGFKDDVVIIFDSKR